MTGQVVRGLRQTVTKRRLTGQKAKTIRGVCDYVYRNRERMRHDEYLRNGWPIASGTVEGARKNLIENDDFAWPHRDGWVFQPTSQQMNGLIVVGLP